MSGREASQIESKRIDGKVEQNEDFTTANGELWRRKPKPLGQGGYSQVYLYENGGTQWAVKTIANISGGGRTDRAEIEKEKAAMIKFSDQKRFKERFINFIGWFANGNIEYFALEYAKLGDLEYNLNLEELTTGDGLPEAEVKTILTQILEGVEFMHAEGYIHRDLKPQNILVAQKGPDWQVKITDLGLSKCTIGVFEEYSFTGTPPYMAPEIYNSMLDPSKYTKAIDIWAVGCIACRIVIGKPPFLEPWLLVQYLKAIKEDKPLDQLCKEVPYIPKDLAGLLDMRTSKGLFFRQLLEPKPGKRPSAGDAKGHSWFQDLDVNVLGSHPRYILHIAFSPKSKLLVSASSNCTITLWSVEERKRKHIIKIPVMDDVAMAFLRDSRLVVLARGFASKPCGSVRFWDVRVWDTATGEVKHGFEIPCKGAHTTTRRALSPDGSLVAAAPDGHTIELWHTEKGKRIHIIQNNEEAMLDKISWSSNGESMVSLFCDGTVRLRNTGNGIEEPVFKGSRSIIDVAVSPNGRVLALRSIKGIWLWDKEEEEAKCVYEKPWVFVAAKYFSLDGKLAVFDALDHDIRLYNTEREDGTRVLKGHSNNVRSVAFSPDSRLLASASQDKTVRLWDVEKGEELCILRAHADGVLDVTFSPCGDLVATASDDGIIGLWNVSQWKNRK